MDVRGCLRVAIRGRVRVLAARVRFWVSDYGRCRVAIRGRCRRWWSS